MANESLNLLHIRKTLYTTNVLLYCELCIVTNAILNRIRAMQGNEQNG